jgi:leader peptidase (prepilin peptidase) / N-methyltransferase
MNWIWASAGAVAGLLAGAAFRATVFRLSAAPDDQVAGKCARCGARASRRLAVRCAQCRASLGVPLVLELATAAVLTLLLGRFGGQPDVVAFAFFGAIGVALAAIDIAVQRLPDRLTLPAYPILIALLGAAALLSGDAAALGRALLGCLALSGCFLVLALVRPGHLGGGDIKLAGLTGLVLGWLGWPALITGAALAFVLSAIVSLALLAARRVTLRSAMSFGPFLVAGTVLAALMSAR